MTITKKYLDIVLSYLGEAGGEPVKSTLTPNGIKYEFPCPFCSINQKKNYKKRKYCAALLPHPESYSYRFNCLRQQSLDCVDPMSFSRFLEKLNPELFRRYHRERDQRGYTGKGHNLRKYKYPNCSSDLKSEFEQRKNGKQDDAN